MQSSQANCGSTALYNAACSLGRTNLSLEECERACKVSATDGTPTRNLVGGVKSVGLQLVCEVKETREDVAILRLGAALDLGAVAILAVDADTHWATVIGIGGHGRFLYADSAESELVLALTAEELLKKWHNPDSRKHYYAAIIS